MRYAENNRSFFEVIAPSDRALNIAMKILLALMVIIVGISSVAGYIHKQNDLERFEKVAATTLTAGQVTGAADRDVIYVAEVSYEIDSIQRTAETVVDSGTFAGQTINVWFDTHTNQLWQPKQHGTASPIGSLFGYMAFGVFTAAIFGLFSLGAIFETEKRYLERLKREGRLEEVAAHENW